MKRKVLSSTKCLNPLTPSYKIKEINYNFLKEFKENMKKKAILLASMGALVCTVGIAALAVGGANDAFTVKADPTKYSVTFDGSESTTVETPPGSDDYAICTTTARGNKVGVVGSRTYVPQLDHLHFRDETNFFGALELGDFSCRLLNVGARDFGNITGFEISFSGGSLVLRKGDEMEGTSVTSGVKYDVSLTPDDHSAFEMDEHAVEVGDITISSLTIWYSC